MQIPFTTTFSKIPSIYIPTNQSSEIIENFSYENPSESVYKITGVRGSGKTVLLAKIELIVKYLANKPGAISDLMEHVRERNKNRFRQNILKPLLVSGLIEPTIADVPNSPKQKYILTQRGKELL